MTDPATYAMPCTGSALGRPRVLESRWSVTSAARVASNGSSDLARPAHLNSIVTTLGTVANTADAAPVTAGGFGIAKQAAPPRGVPR